MAPEGNLGKMKSTTGEEASKLLGEAWGARRQPENPGPESPDPLEYWKTSSRKKGVWLSALEAILGQICQ